MSVLTVCASLAASLWVVAFCTTVGLQAESLDRSRAFVNYHEVKDLPTVNDSSGKDSASV